jgi:hypothetical protein
MTISLSSLLETGSTRRIEESPGPYTAILALI